MEVIRDIIVAVFAVSVMFSVGIDLTWAQIRVVLKEPLVLLRGLALNHLLVPVLVFGLVILCKIEQPIAAGLLLCASAPGGPIGVMLTQRARGDMAYCIALVVSMTFVNIVSTPLLLSWFMGDSLQNIGGSPALAISKTIIMYLVLPLCIGMFIRRQRETVANRLSRLMPRLTNILFLVIIVGMGGKNAPVMLTLGIDTFLIMILMAGVCVFLGYLLAGGSTQRRTALAFITGIRNVSLSLLLASFWFGDQPETLITVLCYGMVMIVVSGSAVLFLRKRSTSTPGV